MKQFGDMISARMTADPRAELSVLYEKLRALHTRMRYERDLEKLKFYNRELAIVTGELRQAEIALNRKKQGAKVLPFPHRKPVRSA